MVSEILADVYERSRASSRLVPKPRWVSEGYLAGGQEPQGLLIEGLSYVGVVRGST